MNEIYSDGSVGCYCPHGASGKKNQQIDSNISEECYGCKKYKERKKPILSVDERDWHDLMLFIKYHDRKSYLEQKFGELELGM